MYLPRQSSMQGITADIQAATSGYGLPVMFGAVAGYSVEKKTGVVLGALAGAGLKWVYGTYGVRGLTVGAVVLGVLLLMRGGKKPLRANRRRRRGMQNVVTVRYRRNGNSDVRSPTSTSSEVRSPTSTSTEVRSPTSTSTEVRSPTSTSTSTEAYTAGNVTVTGGAGAGATSVTVTLPRAPVHVPRGKRRPGRLSSKVAR